jgi:hypothetical protein
VSGELLPVKAGRPRRADRYALAERDGEISRMAARGMTYAEIAAHYGYSGTGAIANAVKRARDAARARGAEEHKAAQRASLDAVNAAAWDRYNNPGWKYSSTTGAPMKNPQTGEPVPDTDIQDKALNTILKVVAKQMELEGTASPRKSVVASFTIEQRRQLEADILASDARLSGGADDAEIVTAEVVDG